VIVTIVRFNDDSNTKYHYFLYNATQSTIALADTSGSALSLTQHSANSIKNLIVLDKFLIECDFNSVDPSGNSVRGRVHITVPPGFRESKIVNDTIIQNTAGLNVPSSSIPNMDMAAVMGSRTVTFPKGRLIEDFNVTVSMNGDLSDYPLDYYHCVAYFNLYNASAVFQDNTANLPIGIAITGALQGFRIDPTTAQFLEFEGVNEVAFSFDVRRSPLTLAFSSFIIVLMWIISIVVFIISLDVILGAAASTKVPVPSSFIADHPHLTADQARDKFYAQIKMYRKAKSVTAPLLAMPILLIFALPALRNAQPGIPTAGAYRGCRWIFFGMSD